MIKLLFVILAIVETFTISIEDHRKNDKLTTHSIQRWKRQSTCSATQHRCRDGTCIRLDQRCDGQVHCPDGSDEIHPECRNMRCPEHLFRCTYGACVDGTAACNGVKDCADNSDELIPKCRNENVIFGDKFKCNDGEMIDLIYQCDGIANCKDRSDETIQLCGSIICPSHLFQCAYGACVDEGSECDDIDQCADESDESDILCNRKVPRKTTTTEATKLTTAEPTECIVPYNPDNGIYTSNGKHYVPGRTYEFVSLNVTCRPGYKLIGKKTIDCYYGEWSIKEYPKCIRACRVTESPSIVYRCQESSYTGSESTRDCEELEVEGTIIQPECRRPNYYSPTDLQYMFCVNGDWNYYPKCLPECGTMTPKGMPLVVGGTMATRGDVPWHAGIYFKNGTCYDQICGGSLISEMVVLSAAHCFWTEEFKQLPASYYAVAVGQLYREWNNSYDNMYAQRSSVKELILEKRFYGASLNYQYDLAVVVVTDPFVYRTYIRPVCLDFRLQFYEEQLKSGNVGKAAGWGLTTGYKHSESSQLKVLDMPYVPYLDCIRMTSPAFVEYITGDKICAGYGNGTALCKGDSGGGLAFPAQSHGITRFYLRGIVSTSPPSLDDTSCNLYALTSFTDVFQHATLIRKYWLL